MAQEGVAAPSETMESMMSDFGHLGAPVAHSDGTVSFGTDDKLYVRFFDHPVLAGAESQREGRPIYKSVPFVRIIQPGERDRIERPVKESDKHRFPKQWAHYQQGREPIPDGTPIDVLFPNQPELPAMLRHVQVHTIEQLAALSDTGLQGIGMGARDLQSRARKFLEAAKDISGTHQIQRELDAARDEIRQLRQLVQALQNATDDEDNPAPRRRRGRPPKNPQPDMTPEV